MSGTSPGASALSIQTLARHAVAVCLFTFPSLLSAQSIPPAGPSAGDEFWLISTRSMSTSICRLSNPETELRVWRLDPCGRMTASSLPDFLAPGGNALQVIYVHGNRMQFSDVIERGMSIQRRLRQHQPHGEPVRWIFWSWPSEKDGLLLADVREKAARADVQTHYLSWLLRRMQGHGEVLNMIGYSFGARVITGSLHVLAGGQLGCTSLEDAPPITDRHIRVSLLAPALHADWLGPGREHGLAGLNMESLHLFMNSVDPVLAGYWLLDPDTKAPAMGIRGVTCRPRNHEGNLVPLQTHNCSNSVGRHHNELLYYDSRCNANHALAKLVWQVTSPTTTP